MTLLSLTKFRSNWLHNQSCFCIKQNLNKLYKAFAYGHVTKSLYRKYYHQGKKHSFYWQNGFKDENYFVSCMYNVNMACQKHTRERMIGDDL